MQFSLVDLVMFKLVKSSTNKMATPLGNVHTEKAKISGMKQVAYSKYIARGFSDFLAEVSCTPVQIYPFAAVIARLNPYRVSKFYFQSVQSVWFLDYCCKIRVRIVIKSFPSLLSVSKLCKVFQRSFSSDL